MRNIYIIGCGGLGRETAWVIDRINREHKIWNICGFIDDNPELKDCLFNGIPVIGDLNKLTDQAENARYVIAIANPVIRKTIASRLKSCENLHPTVLIDPSVIISDTVEIGEGTIILPGCVITVNVKLDEFVIINYSTTIGHDCQIGSYSTVYPGAHIAGNVTVKSGSQIGTGAVVLQGLTVESDIFIGGQAAVIDSVSQKGTYVGVPAHKLPEKNQ